MTSILLNDNENKSSLAEGYPFSHQNINQSNSCTRVAKVKSSYELIQEFWNAHPLTFFGQNVIAPVRDVSIATLENERWYGKGIPFRKVSGRVLYRKSDVVAFLEGHDLLTSTRNINS